MIASQNANLQVDSRKKSQHPILIFGKVVFLHSEKTNGMQNQGQVIIHIDGKYGAEPLTPDNYDITLTYSLHPKIRDVGFVIRTPFHP